MGLFSLSKHRSSPRHITLGWRKLVLSANQANFESRNIEEFRNVFPAYDVQFVANCFSAFIRGSTVYYVNFDSELRYQPIKDSNQYRSIELEDIKPVKVDGTAQHIYVLDDDGLLFQISQTPCEKHLLLNEGDIKFKSFACGKEHLVALSYNGDVYSYGGGSRGQLGNGSIETSSKLQIVEALQGVKMKQVVAGGWHNLVLSEIGDIYSWGWNEAGQAGLPCLKDSNGNVKQDKSSGSSLIRYPTLLFEDDVDLTFTDISAGSRHSAALTDAGDLYTWGWNQYGQIGAVSESVIVCDTPYKVLTKGRKISSVKCACWDTLIFADDSS